MTRIFVELYRGPSLILILENTVTVKDTVSDALEKCKQLCRKHYCTHWKLRLGNGVYYSTSE